jgi:glycosyltransferase involved in cell wall biosynthesis
VSDSCIPGLVTAVVASYNHSKFLPDRMSSLLSQTYSMLEILVIDDFSPDNSVEILRSFEPNPKLKIIAKQKNSGWASVNNEGIKLSRGEFILFANCDDACDFEMVSSLVSALNANPTAGLAFCRSNMIDENNFVLGDDFEVRERIFKKRCQESTLLSGSEITRFLLKACVIPNLSAALFRRAALDQVGNFSTAYRVCCDWDLFFRIAERYDVAYIALPLNQFRQHATTVRSATKSKFIFEEYFRLLLGRIRITPLSLFGEITCRIEVVHIWAVNLIPPRNGLIKNIPYHLHCIFKADPLTLALVPLGLFKRIVDLIFLKIPRKFFNS